MTDIHAFKYNDKRRETMKKLITLLLVVAMMASMIACSAQPAVNEAPAEGTEPAENVEPAEKGPKDYAGSQLLLGSSSAGGTYYVLGAGWVTLMNDLLGTHATCEVTAGPASNIPEIEVGNIDFGMVTSWLAGEGYTGTGWAQENGHGPYLENEAMFPTHCSYLYIFTLADSDINSLSDLAGRPICMGTAGSTSDNAGRGVIKTLGIEPKSISLLASTDQVNALKDGTVDAAFAVTGSPAPWLLDLQTTHDFKFIPYTEEEFAKLFEAFPFWSTDVIPGGTYTCVADDYETISFWNYIVADKDLSEEMIYDMTKATFENTDHMLNVDVSAAGITLDNLNKITTPLHPGAYKYYTEIGVEVPDAIKPVE